MFEEWSGGDLIAVPDCAIVRQSFVRQRGGRRYTLSNTVATLIPTRGAKAIKASRDNLLMFPFSTSLR
jgi:hypothetical protein